MNRAPLIMFAVAAMLGLAGVAVLVTPGTGEGAVYARRITATMLIALALTLAFYATMLASWSTPS